VYWSFFISLKQYLRKGCGVAGSLSDWRLARQEILSSRPNEEGLIRLSLFEISSDPNSGSKKSINPVFPTKGQQLALTFIIKILTFT